MAAHKLKLSTTLKGKREDGGFERGKGFQSERLEDVSKKKER